MEFNLVFYLIGVVACICYSILRYSPNLEIVKIDKPYVQTCLGGNCGIACHYEERELIEEEKIEILS